MKKFWGIIVCLFIFSVISFAVPSQPTDQSSFRNGMPPEPPIPNVPYPIPRESYLSKPLPTNKWFNSVILPYQ